MGGDADRHRLRATSDEAPELYDRARAPYPPNLLADFVTLANLREARRVLEIGCGTSLATVPLAGPGLEIVGIDLGPLLAAIARRGWSASPTCGSSPPPLRAGNRRAASASKPSAPAPHSTGSIPTCATRSPRACFETAGNSQSSPRRTCSRREATVLDRRAGGLRRDRAELEASDVTIRRHLWSVSYMADEYIEVLETYSGHRILDERLRQRLYERIRRRIEARPDGKVELPQLATLTVGRRV